MNKKILIFLTLGIIVLLGASILSISNSKSGGIFSFRNTPSTIQEKIRDRSLIEELRSKNTVDTKDNLTKTYISLTREILIKDNEETLIKMRLTSPYHVTGLIASKDTKVAWGVLIDWEDGRKDLVDTIEQFNIMEGYEPMNREVWFKYGTDKEDCPEGDICTQYIEWKRFETLDELPHKNIKISIWTSTQPRESVEWIPIINGFEVLQWASYNISEMVEVGELSVRPEEGAPSAIEVANNGSFFLVGGSTKYIHQYDGCSQTWNVSTCSYNGKQKIMTAMTISARINGITICGSKLMVSDDLGHLGEFNWNEGDIESASFVDEIDMSPIATGTSTFSPDGFHAYTIEEVTGNIVQWDCTTACDVSTCSDVSDDYNSNGWGRGITFIADQWWKSSQVSPEGIFEYNMGTPNEVDTSTLGVNISVPTGETALQGMTWGGAINGTYMYIIGTNNDTIRQYRVEPDVQPEAIAPNVTILSPENTIYSNPINFSALVLDNVNMTNGECWVTVDGGVTNNSMTNITHNDIYNFTALSVYSTGGYLAEFYCNDSLGNLNDTESISFNVVVATINITSPINNTNWSDASLDVNYTYAYATSCWYSNDTYSKNISFSTCGENLTTILWSDGLHDVTLWGEDGSGNVDSSRVSFTIDLSSPETNITSPIDLVNYQRRGQNLTINFTVSDPFLESCWGSFNGGINNFSFNCLDLNVTLNTTSFNNNTFTLWANDSFGQIGTTTRTWIYKVFEINQTFNSQTTEGSLETFLANINLGSGYSISQVLLIYNSSAIPGVSSTSGQITTVRKTDFQIPNVEANTNFTFSWNLTLSDSTIINLNSYNQTVYTLGLDNCTVYTTELYNFTVVEEELQTILPSATIEIAVNVYDKIRSEVVLNYSNLFESVNPLRICLSRNITNDSEYSIDTIVRYESLTHANSLST